MILLVTIMCTRQWKAGNYRLLIAAEKNRHLASLIISFSIFIFDSSNWKGHWEGATPTDRNTTSWRHNTRMQMCWRDMNFTDEKPYHRGEHYKNRELHCRGRCKHKYSNDRVFGIQNRTLKSLQTFLIPWMENWKKNEPTGILVNTWSLLKNSNI